MGKISMKEIAERHFGKTLWDVFRKDFKECKSPVDAAKRLLALSGGKVMTTPLTVSTTVQKGLDNGQVRKDDFFAAWAELKPVPVEGETSKKRGRQPGKPLKERLEEYYKKPWTEVLSPWARNDRHLSSICKNIGEESNIKINPQHMKDLIMDAITNKEIAKTDYIARIVQKAINKEKHKNDVVEEKVPILSTMSGILTCSECEQTTNAGETVLDSHYPMFFLRARKCPHCHKWNTLSSEGIYKGKKFKTALIEDKNGGLFEAFVNSKKEEVANPFEVKNDD